MLVGRADAGDAGCGVGPAKISPAQGRERKEGAWRYWRQGIFRCDELLYFVYVHVSFQLPLRRHYTREMWLRKSYLGTHTPDIHTSRGQERGSLDVAA